MNKQINIILIILIIFSVSGCQNTAKSISNDNIMVSQFGNINSKNLNEYYYKKIKIGNTIVEVDLNFENKYIEKSKLVKVSQYLKNIEEHLNNAMQIIEDDYDLGTESEAAQFYLNIHQKNLDSNDLQKLFGEKKVSKKSFLSKLQVYRVGIYPENDEDFIIIDIQFPRSITNYLMAVTFDSTLKLTYIGIDS